MFNFICWKDIYLSLMLLLFFFYYLQIFFCSISAKNFHPHVTHGGHDGHILHRLTMSLEAPLVCFKLLSYEGFMWFFCINLFEITSIYYYEYRGFSSNSLLNLLSLLWGFICVEWKLLYLTQVSHRRGKYTNKSLVGKVAFLTK